MFSKGLLRTFQIAHEFTNLTVLENLMMVPANQSGESLVNALLKPTLVNKEEEQVRNKAYEVIEFLNLKHLANELAGNLSGGQKKLLELGRTMMVDSKLVLLDEVGAGVNRTLLKEIGTSIQRLNKEKGYTFCMIEHDMDFISRLCNPVIVMAEGSVLFQGTSEEVKKNEKVIESYLGRANKELGTAILRLNKEKNYTFCMIEHDMDFISRMCDPVIVMAEGSVLFEGTSEEVKKNEKVIESYLGRANKNGGENN